MFPFQPGLVLVLLLRVFQHLNATAYPDFLINSPDDLRAMYYQTSYDPIRNRNYDRLQDGIKSYELNYQILLSTWIIKSDGTATEISDKLRAFIDGDDVLFVFGRIC